MLTHKRLQSLLHYNPVTGVFTHRVTKGGSAYENTVAGTIDSDGYVKIRVDGKKYKAHRLAWFYVIGEWPENDIDHKDGVRSNNRWRNLRDATRQTNSQNAAMRCDNTSGYTGVRFRHGRFEARITYNGRVRHIGRFDTAEEAHIAYLSVKQLMHKQSPVQRPNHRVGANPDKSGGGE